MLPLCAVPLLSADSIAGKWNFVWDTEGGIRETVWDISQDGEALTVKSAAGQFKGAFKDNRLVVQGSLYSAEAGYSATLKVEGTYANREMTGSGSWDQYAMTFKAKRIE